MCYFSKFEKVSPLIVQNIKTTLRHFDQNFQHFTPILKHTVWWYSCKWKQSKGNPCVLVFVVDICPAVLWLLFRFPTLNTMGVLYYTYYLFIDRGQKCHHWDYFFCGGLWVSQPDALAGSSPPRLGLWLSPWKEIFLPLPKFNICGGPQ